MRRISNLNYWVVYAFCIVYFILRLAYIVSKSPIVDFVTIAMGIVVGSSMLIFAVQMFFIENKKREAFKPLLLSIAIILLNIAYMR